MKIGFIGLGIMGRPMAGHLVAGGHQLFVHDIKPAPVELTSQGAVACASGKEAAGARRRRHHHGSRYPAC